MKSSSLMPHSRPARTSLASSLKRLSVAIFPSWMISLPRRSRAEAFPGLAHSGRRYSQGWERNGWDHARVMRHLSGYAVARRVDKNGDVWLYHRPHYVGVAHRNETVYVTVDPVRVEWLFSDERGQQLRRQPAEELSAERIRRLTVSKRD